MDFSQILLASSLRSTGPLGRIGINRGPEAGIQMAESRR